MLEVKAKDQGHKCKCFPEKKGLKKFFFGRSTKKNGLGKHFPADLQNFNHSKKNAVLEPRTKGGGGGGMPQFCILFFANYTILATQRGGPWPNAPPPKKHAPATAYQCERHKKKISFYNSQTYWK